MHRAVLAVAGLTTAGLLSVVGVAVADTPPATGPDSPACTQAGAAVAVAQTLLADYKTLVADTAAKKTADTDLAADKAELPAADPYLTGTDAATVAARIKANQAYIADQNNTAANIAKAQQYLAFDQKLAAAITAEASANTNLAAAQQAYAKDGGNTALGVLAANGGLPALVTAQNKACGTNVPVPAPGPVPAPVPAPTTGGNSGGSTSANNSSGGTVNVGAPAGTSGAQVAVVPAGVNTGRA